MSRAFPLCAIFVLTDSRSSSNIPPPTFNPPVELPTSINPGESPLPAYANTAGRGYSWGQGTEGTYRPSKP